MDYQYIKLEQQDKVAVLTLNDPSVLNAMCAQMVQEMSHAITHISKPDSGVRCLLMTGEGRAFCSGANLSAPAAADELPPAGHVLETHYAPVMNKLRHLPFPFVSAVNGPAVGVGMSFAIVADFVVAGESAYFLQAFANIGLIPDGGATYFLPRMIGWGRALELSLLAERLPAATAAEWGLVNRVVADDKLMEEAMSYATRLSNGPKSLSMIREAYWQSLENSFAEQLQLESNLQSEAQRTFDNREGVTAFLEKRKAKFEGR